MKAPAIPVKIVQPTDLDQEISLTALYECRGLSSVWCWQPACSARSLFDAHRSVLAATPPPPPQVVDPPPHRFRGSSAECSGSDSPRAYRKQLMSNAPGSLNLTSVRNRALELHKCAPSLPLQTLTPAPSYVSVCKQVYLFKQPHCTVRVFLYTDQSLTSWTACTHLANRISWCVLTVATPEPLHCTVCMKEVA